MKEIKRCWWCGDDVLYQSYHDHEWGVPLHDDRALFEFLCLEGAQAGLSWITILRKRENYQRLFDHFDIEKMIRYDEQKIQSLLENPGIIRNKLKVNGFVKNARAAQAVLDAGVSLNDYFWQFVDGETIQNSWTSSDQVPGFTDLSVVMSKALKKQGFTFVGPTICYAFMQATGMINDHLTDCYRHTELG